MPSTLTILCQRHHLLLLLLLLTTPLLASAAGCNKADKAALLAVKSAFGNPPGLASWTSKTPCCSWSGISCNITTGRVTELTVFALNISATIPAAIANLTALRSLNLAYNQLQGPIPAFIGTELRDLTFLRLDGNRLSGTIPPSLTIFDLSLVGNRLTGTLPSTFGDANFGDVDLADNELTGDASFLFGENKNLNALRLSNNKFSFDLSNVELPKVMDILDIDHNMIDGRIPPAAAARKWLQFDVSYNRLCGPIPQGRYLRRYGAKHFAGNKCLCGAPLAPCK